MKKKLITLGATALALVSPLSAATAFAEGGTTKTDAGDNSAVVKYSVDESFSWAIHPDVSFEKNAGAKSSRVVENQAVQIKTAILQEGHTLKITIKGDGANDAFSIKNGAGSNVLNYAVNNGDKDFAVGDEVLSCEAGAEAPSASLKFTLTTTSKAQEVAGNYSGHVIYTAGIEGTAVQS